MFKYECARSCEHAGAWRLRVCVNVSECAGECECGYVLGVYLGRADGFKPQNEFLRPTVKKPRL